MTFWALDASTSGLVEGRGLNERLMHLFLREIYRQTTFSLMAARGILSGALSKEHVQVWFQIQAFLVSTGNISKLMWPAGKETQDRGEALRARLSVLDDSPLRDRRLRNHFEHFDTRLDQWAAESRKKWFVDSGIGRVEDLPDVDVQDSLRNFDPRALVISVRGDTYEFELILRELLSLYPRVTHETRRGYRKEWTEFFNRSFLGLNE